MPDALANSKRIKALRQELIGLVPRSPNDRASLQAMNAKTLNELLVVFIGWRLRYVGMRQREVVGRDVLARDSRAAVLKENIDTFLEVVEKGGNLVPYLSIKPRTKGYTPAAEQRGPGANWADKDFLLNVMGLHHFHLGLTMEAAGHVARTNELIFASVTRDRFEIIGLVDHAVFDHESDGSMTSERTALWSLYEQYKAANGLGGQLSIGGFADMGISTNGQPVEVVRTAQEHVCVMQKIDPKLDNPAFVQSLYPDGTAKSKLKWHYNHLDFGLLDESTGCFLVLRHGPN